MAMRFVDSFDHYATGDILEKWFSNAGFAAIGSGGRFSTNCFQAAPSSFNFAQLQAVVPGSAFQTWICGVAWKPVAVTGSGETFVPLGIFDGGTTQVDVRWN